MESNNQNRADRILIGIALLIIILGVGAFYFDDWMWGARRDRGERIGVIAEKSGDIRVKFEGDLKWDKAARGQDLMYNDSIYAGSESEAKVQLGESEMTVNQNTLIVLRRENLTNFLNLNYGTLFGKLAKNEKVIIDTGEGEPVELSTKKASQIVLSKKDGKLKLDVLSGEANLVVNGKKSTVTKDSSVVLDGKGAKIEKASLVAVKPLKDQVIYSEGPRDIEFQWAWTQQRPAKPEEVYTLEFAAQPSFEKVLKSKTVTGMLNTTMSVSQTLKLWYRVRGPNGEISPIEKVNFVRLLKPVIIKPVAQQKYEAMPGEKTLVEFQIRHAKGTAVWYQVSTDQDFGRIVANQNTPEERTFQELGIGAYFVRARSDFGDNRLSEWSDSVPFRVDSKLRKTTWPEVPTLSRVLIPNRAYPARLYGAPGPQVREFLARGGFLRDFFPFDKDSFDELKVQFAGESQGSVQSHAAWPTRRLYPGTFKFQYQVSKSGFVPSQMSSVRRLEIMMEPPKPLGEAQLAEPDTEGKRDVAWQFTPLLFAGSYDVEVSASNSFTSGRQLRVNKPEAMTKLPPGQFFWRARARDGKGRIISEFSSAKRIVVPRAVPQYLAKNEREPQATEKTVTKVERVKQEYWEKSGWWAWLGAGTNYVDYRQSITGREGGGTTVAGGSLDSTNLKGPSQFFETGYIGSNGWGGVVSYKNTPGEMLIDNVPISSPEYTWTTISVEGTMRRRSPFNLMKQPLIYGLRLGVQQHKTPFVHVDFAGRPQLKLNQMNTASLGVLAELARKRWRYYWLMRYQFPMSAEASDANTFEITPTFAFDGSVGTSYNLTEQLKLGMFWYGQWHQYNFVYSDRDVTNSGFQSLFYSNIDLRVGFDF